MSWTTDYLFDLKPRWWGNGFLRTFVSWTCSYTSPGWTTHLPSSTGQCCCRVYVTPETHDITNWPIFRSLYILKWKILDKAESFSQLSLVEFFIMLTSTSRETWWGVSIRKRRRGTLHSSKDLKHQLRVRIKVRKAYVHRDLLFVVTKSIYLVVVTHDKTLDEKVSWTLTLAVSAWYSEHWSKNNDIL